MESRCSSPRAVMSVRHPTELKGLQVCRSWAATPLERFIEPAYGSAQTLKSHRNRLETAYPTSHRRPI